MNEYRDNKQLLFFSFCIVLVCTTQYVPSEKIVKSSPNTAYTIIMSLLWLYKLVSVVISMYE